MRNDRLLFEHLELELAAGQMLVVEGPNGCGKTSLLRILTGLRLADGGEVRWRGEPIDRLAGDYFEQVNYVGHHDGVKHELSCLENLRLARAMGVPSKHDLDDVLDQVNLYAYGETEVGSLSAGQNWRDCWLSMRCCGYWTSRSPHSTRPAWRCLAGCSNNICNSRA